MLYFVRKDGFLHMISGNRIKERRVLLNISADELAEAVGKNRATVYRYENGDISTIPLGTFKKIADYLNTSIVYLMGMTDDPTPLRISQDSPAFTPEEKEDMRYRSDLLDAVRDLKSEGRKHVLDTARFLVRLGQSASDTPSAPDSSSEPEQ